MARPALSDDGSEKPSVIVKKYANRRLYNTETSSYITLEHLAALTREGREFKVLDAKTDETLLPMVCDEVNRAI